MIISDSIERKIMSEIDEMGKFLRNATINLGGIDGSNGGGGSRFIGKLPQTKVTFDTTESTDSTIPASGLSLLINLNRIRSGVSLGDGVILPRHLSSGVGVVKVIVEDIDGSPSISASKIIITDGLLTDMGGGVAKLDLDKLTSVISASGYVPYRWTVDGPLAIASGVDGIHKLPGQYDVKNIALHAKIPGTTITTVDIQSSPDGINWTTIFSGSKPTLISGQHYSNFSVAGVHLTSGYLLRSSIYTSSDYIKDLTISLEGNQSSSSVQRPEITLVGDVTGTGNGTITTTIPDSSINLSTKVNNTLSPLNGGTGVSNAGTIYVDNNISLIGGGYLTLEGKTVFVNNSGPIPVGYQQVLFTIEGNLAVESSPFRIYNRTGVTRTLLEVFLSVSTAPVGNSVLVDVNKDGTTIFTTQSNRPSILDGSTEGSSILVDVTTWEHNSYLTIDVDQIGIASVGRDLVVHIVYY